MSADPQPVWWAEPRGLGLLLALTVMIAGCGSGTEPEPPSCTDADLQLHVEVRPVDATKRPLVPGDAIALALVVYNRCGATISFETPNLCLAHRFSLIEPGGAVREGGVDCAGAPRWWTIPSDDGRAVRFELGVLPAGSYTVEVPVTFSARIARAEFVVPEAIP
jgi:hypothetical protein